MFIPKGPLAIIELLKSLGDECVYDPEQTCCGRDFFMRGERESAILLGNEFINRFCYTFGKNNTMNSDPIVVPSSSCVSFIKKNFPTLFTNTALPSAIQHLHSDLHELCDYIVNVKGVECLNNKFAHRVFYFQSCSARNYCQISDEAAQILLKNTEDIDLVTNPEMKLCCSANGNFAMNNPEVSEHLLKTIVEAIVAEKAEFVTTTDPHCLQYLDAYLAAHPDIHLVAIPITEILLSNRSK